MDLDDLKALICTAEQGSFKKACQILGMSRTTLRRRIEGLEREFGAQLLVRDELGVRPTRAGDAVIERVSPLIVAAEDLVRAAREGPIEPAGKVRLIVPVGMPTMLQARLVLDQRSSIPGLQVDFNEVGDPLEHVDTPFELMLHFGPAPTRGTWFSRVVRRLPLQLHASPGYLARAGIPSSAEALADHALMHWRVGDLDAQAWPLRAGGTVPVRPWCHSPNIAFLCALAAIDGGIVLGPSDVATLSPEGAGLVPVLQDQIGGELQVRLTTPVPAKADAGVREVLRRIHDAIAGMQD